MMPQQIVTGLILLQLLAWANPFSHAAAPSSPFWACSSLNRGVALTFDDGPGQYTDKLLDELRDANVTATFFVLVGAALRYPDTVRRALAEGHTIGLHSWSHANLTGLAAASDWASLHREVDDAADTLEKITGQRPLYFRPPYGALSAKVRDYLHARGFRIAMWNLGNFDWWMHDAAKELQLYIAGMPDSGGIICLHDGDTHETTVNGVPRLIAALRSGPEGGWANPQARPLLTLEQCVAADDDGDDDDLEDGPVQAVAFPQAAWTAVFRLARRFGW